MPFTLSSEMVTRCERKPKWRNGRRRGFKIPRLNGRAGSSPALGTIVGLASVNPANFPLKSMLLGNAVP